MSTPEPNHTDRSAPHPGVLPGGELEVRNRFDRAWVRGFDLVETISDEDGRPWHRVRRRCDQVVLPILFAACDIRPAWSGD